MKNRFTYNTKTVKILGLGLTALLLFSIQCSSGGGDDGNSSPWNLTNNSFDSDSDGKMESERKNLASRYKQNA